MTDLNALLKLHESYFIVDLVELEFLHKSIQNTNQRGHKLTNNEQDMT